MVDAGHVSAACCCTQAVFGTETVVLAELLEALTGDDGETVFYIEINKNKTRVSIEIIDN